MTIPCSILDCKKDSFPLSTKKYCLNHYREFEFVSTEPKEEKVDFTCKQICSKFNPKSSNDEKDSLVFIIICKICEKKFAFSDIYDKEKDYQSEKDFLVCPCCDSPLKVPPRHQDSFHQEFEICETKRKRDLHFKKVFDKQNWSKK